MDAEPDAPFLLVLRHVPHEDIGALAGVLEEHALAHRYIDLFRERPQSLPLSSAAGLVVLGGPMNVDQTDRFPFLACEIGWIQQAVAGDLPVLGVCLGSQLLAKALGAKVYPNGRKEIGWHEVERLPAADADPLFSTWQRRQTVFQWHGDTFDLPAGAVHLAQSDVCRHQAFRFGRRAYGLQFHVEVDPPTVERWLAEPQNCAELSTLDYVEADAIRRDTPAGWAQMQGPGRQLLSSFCRLCRD